MVFGIKQDRGIRMVSGTNIATHRYANQYDCQSGYCIFVVSRWINKIVGLGAQRVNFGSQTATFVENCVKLISVSQSYSVGREDTHQVQPGGVDFVYDCGRANFWATVPVLGDSGNGGRRGQELQSRVADAIGQG